MTDERTDTDPQGHDIEDATDLGWSLFEMLRDAEAAAAHEDASPETTRTQTGTAATDS